MTNPTIVYPVKMGEILAYRISANSFRGFFFEFGLMYCDLWLQYIQVRKLFKGGNYSRKYGILPRSDCEKWSRNFFFEIPPCASHFLLNEFTS
jgi:hypothetical protein